MQEVLLVLFLTLMAIPYWKTNREMKRKIKENKDGLF